MFWAVTLIPLLLCSGAYSETSSSRSFYSNFLFTENSSRNVGHKNFEGFIENVKNNIKVPVESERTLKNVEAAIEDIHNILFKTFYECTASKPKATTFSEAVDGMHTPDSQHYASLLHSALYTKSILTDFFKTPTHYGVHYKDLKTDKELFWCIITPLAKKGAAKSVKAYVKIFNKYKNPEINGKENIKESDVKIMSTDEFFSQLNQSKK
jgi:hypothetical protein